MGGAGFRARVHLRGGWHARQVSGLGSEGSSTAPPEWARRTWRTSSSFEVVKFVFEQAHCAVFLAARGLVVLVHHMDGSGHGVCSDQLEYGYRKAILHKFAEMCLECLFVYACAW